MWREMTVDGVSPAPTHTGEGAQRAGEPGRVSLRPVRVYSAVSLSVRVSARSCARVMLYQLTAASWVVGPGSGYGHGHGSLVVKPFRERARVS